MSLLDARKLALLVSSPSYKNPEFKSLISVLISVS